LLGGIEVELGIGEGTPGGGFFTAFDPLAAVFGTGLPTGFF